MKVFGSSINISGLVLLIMISHGQSAFMKYFDRSIRRIRPNIDKSLKLLNNESEDYTNKNNKRDQIFSALSKCGGIKVTAITARNMMNELMLQHDLSEVAADALGRSIICGLLLSNGMQEEQTYQLTINGDGPLRGVFSICTGKGEARGYVGNSALNGFNLEEAIGKGTVQVVKNHPEWPNPFNGITAIRHGDIDRDVGIYLAESEQRSCALAAGTCVSNILFKAACGYLVEQLPEVETKVIEKVEQNLQDLVGKHGGDVSVPTNLFLNGISPFQISEQILDGLEMMPLQQITPVLKCECTEDRLFRSIRLLPLQEVEEILEENNGVEARCHFCGKKYKMNALQVRERFVNAKGDPSHG